MNIRIDTLCLNDVVPASDVIAKAFGRVDDLSPVLRRYLAIQPDGWIVARDGDSIVGTLGATEYGNVAYLGLITVHPEHQHRGIASELMSHALAKLETRGVYQTLLDATDSGIRLYERFGYRDAGPSHQFAHAFPPRSVGMQPGICSVVNRLDEVIAFDQRYFGAQRRAVIEQLFAEFPDRFFIFCDHAGSISGYIVALSQTVGPWVAQTPSIAEALFESALSLPFTGPVQVQIPGESEASMKIVEANGFNLARSVRHMRRGPNQLYQTWQHIYAKASYALG